MIILEKKEKMSHEETMELIRKSQNGCSKSREKLINQNVRLVSFVINKHFKSRMQFEDLFQIGCIGLIKSIDRFDLSFNVKFTTYAVPMIKSEIQRFLRDDNYIKVPRSLKELSFKIEKVKSAFFNEKNRLPSNEELSELLDVPVKKITDAIDSNRQIKSMFEIVHENDGEPLCLIDMIGNETNTNVEDFIDLSQALSGLTEKERFILHYRYVKDMTQSEVGELLNISQVQISRLEKSALQKVKNIVEEKLLKKSS